MRKTNIKHTPSLVQGGIDTRGEEAKGIGEFDTDLEVVVVDITDVQDDLARHGAVAGMDGAAGVHGFRGAVVVNHLDRRVEPGSQAVRLCDFAVNIRLDPASG